MMIMLSSKESGKCVALIVMKGLLRCISRRNRVPLSRMTGRVLASTRSGDLVCGLLDFGQASFDLEVISLFPDGVYKGGEGAHRLAPPMNCFSP